MIDYTIEQKGFRTQLLEMNLASATFSLVASPEPSFLVCLCLIFHI